MLLVSFLRVIVIENFGHLQPSVLRISWKFKAHLHYTEKVGNYI